MIINTLCKPATMLVVLLAVADEDSVCHSIAKADVVIIAFNNA